MRLPPLALMYKGQQLKQFAPEHRAQVLNYLKATGLRLGLQVNFGCAPKARVERMVL